MKLRVALMVPDTDEAISRTIRIGRLWKSSGDDVAVVTLRTVAPLWRSAIDDAGLGLVTVESTEDFTALAAAFDVVWFPEHGPLAVGTLRDRRWSGRRTPLVAVAGGDAYCVRHADVVGEENWEEVRAKALAPAEAGAEVQDDDEFELLRDPAHVIPSHWVGEAAEMMRRGGVDGVAAVLSPSTLPPVLLVRRSLGIDSYGGPGAALERMRIDGREVEISPTAVGWRGSAGAEDDGAVQVARERLGPVGLGNAGGVLRELDRERISLERRNEELAQRLRNRVPRNGEPHGRLRILHLLPYLPYPPLSGGRMRSWFMAKYLDARHDLTLLAFSDVGTERTVRQAARELSGACFGVTHGQLAGGGDLPPLVRGHYRENMRAALKLIPFEQFDVALVDSLYMAAYRDEMPTNAVLCEQNIESELVSEGAERELVRAFENRTWRKFPLRFVTSEVDLAIMNSRCTSGRAMVVPNGADPDQEIGDARPDLNTVLLAGSLDYQPNIDGTEWFMAEIWPLIRRRNSSARLLIAGRNPPEAIRRFDGRDGALVIPNPPKMAAVAARTSVSIAPLRLGSGTRVKILDSFAWGIPVVSTPKGCEGLDAGDGEHLLIRAEPEEFAEACDRVLRDRTLWTALRRNGRELLRARYSWNSIFAACERELREHLAGIGGDYRRRLRRA